MTLPAIIKNIGGKFLKRDGKIVTNMDDCCCYEYVLCCPFADGLLPFSMPFYGGLEDCNASRTALLVNGYFTPCFNPGGGYGTPGCRYLGDLGCHYAVLSAGSCYRVSDEIWEIGDIDVRLADYDCITPVE